MALNIKIDLDDCYALKSSTTDLSIQRFDTILKDGNIVPIGIHISEQSHPLMPNVHNLGFGPLNENDEIDDHAKLEHQNHFRCIQKNYDYLNKYFNIYGVDYYVRILRTIREQDSRYNVDGKRMMVVPYLIQKEKAPKFEGMSNYFIFNLK